MRIGIDIDDTITDTYLVVMKYIAEHYGINYEDLLAKEYSYDDFFRDSDYKGFKEFVNENFHKVIPSLKPKEKASQIISKLKEEGHEIFIITARSSAKENQNIEFLKAHNIPYDKFYEGIWEKGELAKKENIDIFIDDNYIHYKQCKDKNIRAVLFDAPYNKKYKECERVTSWIEFYNIVNKK